MEYFVFGDVDSRDYNVWVYPSEIDSAPQREYTEIVIAGRNGTLTIDNGRYENIDHVYSGVIFEETAEDDLKAFRNALTSQMEYKRLEDSINTDEFYEARFMEELKPVLTENRDAVKFEIKFNRKPQRFLKSGETTYTYTANGSITNPTQFEAKPLIKVTGYGTLGVGDRSVIITGTAGQVIYIDCEIMEAWSMSGSAIIPRNDYVQYVGNKFPVLASGVNGISMSGNITRVEVTPRWWRL